MPKIPTSNRLKDPKLNGEVNPRNNGIIDPMRNWRIDPARNWQIDPARNWQINPARNWQINPARNWLINPTRNWQINPIRNWQVSPFRNTNFNGLYIFDRADDTCMYYGILAMEGRFMLIFDENSAISFFAVKRVSGYSVYAGNGVYAGHIESNEQNGFNWFDVHGEWRYFLI